MEVSNNICHWSFQCDYASQSTGKALEWHWNGTGMALEWHWKGPRLKLGAKINDCYLGVKPFVWINSRLLNGKL